MKSRSRERPSHVTSRALDCSRHAHSSACESPISERVYLRVRSEIERSTDGDHNLQSLQNKLAEAVSQLVKSQRVLDAIRATPRHLFVPQYDAEDAYSDRPLPIGYDVTISQPTVVGLMSEALGLSGGERVLEVGTGSGYQAALLGKLSAHVDTLELHPQLARRAFGTLLELGVVNVDIHVGDGWRGLPILAPFDRIVVTAAAPFLPEALVGQLAQGGILVLPQGGRSVAQRLMRYEKRGGHLLSEDLGEVRFVPLIRG